MTSHPAAIFVPSPAAWRQSWSTSAIVLAWASLCWLLGELWLSSNVTAPLVPSIALAWFGVGLAVGTLAFSAAGCLASLRRRGRPIPLFAAAAVPLVMFGLFWMVDANGLPLRARFELSQRTLDSIADRAEAGEETMPPFGTLDGGWFTVRGVAVQDGCTRLTTAVDGAVMAGLARCSVQTPSATGLRFDRVTGDWWSWRTE